MTLTKGDLVQQVYKNHKGLTRGDVAESVAIFLRIIKGYLEKLLISPTSSLFSEFYSRNIKYMPVVKF